MSIGRIPSWVIIDAHQVGCDEHIALL
jgi:hypothetical protein